MAPGTQAACLRPPHDFGDPCSEAESVHRTLGVSILDTGIFFLLGEDRIAFLHNLSSNDIKSLSVGQGCETLFLTPKGKIRVPFVALVLPDRVALLAENEIHPTLKSIVESSVIMEDVNLSEPPEQIQFFHMAGPRLNELLKSLDLPTPAEMPLSACADGERILFRSRRSLAVGVDLGVRLSRAETWFEKLKSTAEKLGGRACGKIAMDILRIEAGIPKFGVDYTGDHLPHEAAREDCAVSFTKGCYTGQETVARIKTYGGVNRRLVALLSDGPAACPGDKVFREGAEVGVVTSAARSIKFSKAVALAMVSKGSFAQGMELRVGMPNGILAAVVDIASPGSLANLASWKLA